MSSQAAAVPPITRASKREMAIRRAGEQITAGLIALVQALEGVGQVDEESGLLDPKEAARRLGINRFLVYELVKRRDLVGIRVGKKCIRVKADSIERYIQKRERAAL